MVRPPEDRRRSVVKEANSRKLTADFGLCALAIIAIVGYNYSQLGRLAELQDEGGRRAADTAHGEIVRLFEREMRPPLERTDDAPAVAVRELDASIDRQVDATFRPPEAISASLLAEMEEADAQYDAIASLIIVVVSCVLGAAALVAVLVIAVYVTRMVVKAQWEMENLVGSIAAPMLSTDRDLNVTMGNDAALQAVGFRREEVVGKMTCARPLCAAPDSAPSRTACARAREPLARR
jgi:PAS domain-containing protein